MTAKYALHPGPVTSKNDGDRHFIDAHTLARLYRVSPSDCVVVPWEAPQPGRERERELLLERIERMGLVHLYPSYHGDYTIPKADTMPLYGPEALNRDCGEAGHDEGRCGNAACLRGDADGLQRLRAQLAVSTRGLKHCARWNISDDKRTALMAVVLESEALLAAGPNAEVTGP